MEKHSAELTDADPRETKDGWSNSGDRPIGVTIRTVSKGTERKESVPSLLTVICKSKNARCDRREDWSEG